MERLQAQRPAFGLAQLVQQTRWVSSHDRYERVETIAHHRPLIVPELYHP
jgi:hypothetical protein